MKPLFPKTVALANASYKIDHIHWFLPHNILCFQQKAILSKQILSNTPTELRYFD